MTGCIAPRCQDGRQPGSLFCRAHEQAPNAQRGGWLSAERRRRKLAASAEPLDVSNIVPRLWVGAPPPAERDLPEFDMLVLCAEAQPERVVFHGQVVRCPIKNDVLSHQELAGVIMASRMVAQALGAGKRVLVTCAADANRSSLIAALALARLTRASAAELVMLVRAKRGPHALTTAFFQHVLQKLVGDGRNPYR